MTGGDGKGHNRLLLAVNKARALLTAFSQIYRTTHWQRHDSYRARGVCHRGINPTV